MAAAGPPLRGREALVTGAGSGIGRATALELARAGARVVLLGRGREALEETRAAIAAGGGSARSVTADVSCAEGLEELRGAGCAVDVLVNNAAAYAPYAPLERLAEEDFQRVFDTVLAGAVRLTRELLPGMLERGFGRVVNVGSAAASLGAAGQTAYAAAKAGLAGFTRSLALEVARRGVTCNLVEPGLIDTERVREAVDPEVRLGILAATAAGRAGTPEEVAAAVLFLASPAAGFITGVTLPVAGGLGLGLFSRPPEGDHGGDANR